MKNVMILCMSLLALVACNDDDDDLVKGWKNNTIEFVSSTTDNVSYDIGTLRYVDVDTVQRGVEVYFWFNIAGIEGLEVSFGAASDIDPYNHTYTYCDEYLHGNVNAYYFLSLELDDTGDSWEAIESTMGKSGEIKMQTSGDYLYISGKVPAHTTDDDEGTLEISLRVERSKIK